ncbi:hypothetical protein CW362_06435 [Streptomyces populi]|uniref:Uncharacterized protein n=1 Tax=Streptomyces populi TaxID=2058924 RepID=A0A2I0SVL9_9ACTN|nr:hypothetical protein CW362_06435 [Streptomyces populi]
MAFTAIAATTFSMAPASAVTDITIRDSNGLGSMTFHDDGDTFTVCNLTGRSAYVIGKIWYKPAIGGDWYVTNHKADAYGGGCAKIVNTDVEIVGNYQMKLYYDGSGREKEIAHSRVFNE